MSFSCSDGLQGVNNRYFQLLSHTAESQHFKDSHILQSARFIVRFSYGKTCPHSLIVYRSILPAECYVSAYHYTSLVNFLRIIYANHGVSCIHQLGQSSGECIWLRSRVERSWGDVDVCSPVKLMIRMIPDSAFRIPKVYHIHPSISMETAKAAAYCMRALDTMCKGVVQNQISTQEFVTFISGIEWQADESRGRDSSFGIPRTVHPVIPSRIQLTTRVKTLCCEPWYIVEASGRHRLGVTQHLLWLKGVCCTSYNGST